MKLLWRKLSKGFQVCEKTIAETSDPNCPTQVQENPEDTGPFIPPESSLPSSAYPIYEKMKKSRFCWTKSNFQLPCGVVWRPLWLWVRVKALWFCLVMTELNATWKLLIKGNLIIRASFLAIWGILVPERPIWAQRAEMSIWEPSWEVMTLKHLNKMAPSTQRTSIPLTPRGTGALI